MTVDEFITKWEHCPGSERSNYAVFLTELADVLGVEAPGPNPHYRIDAPVPGGAAGGGTGFIDLYKRGHFILEAKQSNVCEIPSLPGFEDAPVERGQKYDELMRRAFRQARRYAQSLPEPPWPPFIIILDVGRAFEIYFDYAGNGRDYRFFPDRSSYRIPIAELRDEKVRARLRAIWTDPKSLDPALVTAEVTRDIAKRLGSVSAWLEETQRLKTGASAADWEHSAALEETSLFLMRILFCMFAEDAQLLSDDPNERPFKAFLRKTLDDDATFTRGLADLWQKMGQANLSDRWTFAFEHPVKYFNGSLFADTTVFALAKAERGELIAAAEHEWKNVEPAIFGTLLEQALTKNQRSQLGAHYTPRPYVERIVEATITDVLRSEWEAVEAGLEGLEPSDRLTKLNAFHDRLAAIVVLDPACGTGNFLYVSMEALLGIEAKVLQAIEDNGGSPVSRIGPGQLHGLEKNPRAAKIAELVLWIGWLRWRLRNGAGAVEEPVLAQKANINFGRPGGYDAALAQDEMGQPILDNPHQPEWPEADFIVGNPPFIGGKDMRDELGSAYVEALWTANTRVPPSADFVMQWWERASEILSADTSQLRRFGFVTTNSITQLRSRRVLSESLNPTPTIDRKLHLRMACADHPWLKAEPDAAAVRIAMTVVAPGEGEGELIEVEFESGLDTDEPDIRTVTTRGLINPNLTIGTDPTNAKKLRSNSFIASPGVKLHGNGFIVRPEEASLLGAGLRHNIASVMRPYKNGRDILQRPRNARVIDLFDLSEADVRSEFPEIYQHLLRTVLPARKKVVDDAVKKNGKATKDALEYLENWWLFGKNRADLRDALSEIPRYIATVETAKHRVFQFLDASILPDNKLTVVASPSGFHLGVLSSRIHRAWYLANAGMIGVYNQKAVWVKASCWDVFPFPSGNEVQTELVAALGDELDRQRVEALAENPDLTITDIYNWRERIASGARLSDFEEQRATSARAYIVNRLHEEIDEAVAHAYGWPFDLTPAQIVERLVALNAERAAEEAEGKVRWLRPDYQIPRFAKKR